MCCRGRPRLCEHLGDSGLGHSQSLGVGLQILERLVTCTLIRSCVNTSSYSAMRDHANDTVTNRNVFSMEIVPHNKKGHSECRQTGTLTLTLSGLVSAKAIAYALNISFLHSRNTQPGQKARQHAEAYTEWSPTCALVLISIRLCMLEASMSHEITKIRHDASTS